jgi:hypothetical protein
MNRFVVPLLIGLASTAHAQDAVQSVLAAAPQLVSFAGSPENFYKLVTALTEGTPARLAGPSSGGFTQVTTINVPARLGAADVAALLERARQDFGFLGIVQPTAEQLGAVLASGLRAQVRSQLEPDLRTPSPDEQAFSKLPVEIQSLLGGMPPREALLKVQLAQQQLIALGNPHASPERLRAMLQNVLAPQSGGYTVASFSAGSTSFPPMSPLASPYLPATR